MLRVVCFDLMDTVLYDPFREAIEAATGVDLATAARHRDPTCWPAFEIGAIDEAELARRYFASHPAPDAGGSLRTLRFDLDAFHRVRRDGYRFLPGMRELLLSLAGVVERHVASNYPVWIEELGRTFALDQLFEGVWSSHAFGVRKPDARFYSMLLDSVAAPADECLFVDDRDVNCTGAVAAGMKAHLFEGVSGLVARLRAEGLSLDDDAMAAAMANATATAMKPDGEASR